jgi:hypothetical protein
MPSSLGIGAIASSSTSPSPPACKLSAWRDSAVLAVQAGHGVISLLLTERAVAVIVTSPVVVTPARCRNRRGLPWQSPTGP